MCVHAARGWPPLPHQRQHRLGWDKAGCSPYVDRFTGHHTWHDPHQTVSSAQRAPLAPPQTRALQVRWQVAPRLLLEPADQSGRWRAELVRTRLPQVAAAAVLDVGVWLVVPVPTGWPANRADA